MKKSIVLFILLVGIFAAFKSVEKKSVVLNEKVKASSVLIENNVDLAASVLNWKGTKPLGAHTGTVALQSGNLEVDNGHLVGGVFVVDLATIKNIDMAGTKGAGKLEGHLKGADFFDIAQYPTSTFAITSVKNEGEKLAVTGNLQIKKVTKSITIPATIATENGVTIFKSDVFNINRTDFNVKYGSKSFFDNLKDKFIDDIIEMSFVVKTKA